MRPVERSEQLADCHLDEISGGFIGMERYFAGPCLVTCDRHPGLLVRETDPTKFRGQTFPPFRFNPPFQETVIYNSEFKTESSSVNVGLFGYGKMGKEVEAVAKQRSHFVTAIADIDTNTNDVKGQFAECDALIDFSVAAAVPDHVRFAGGIGKPIIIGTTGWQNKLDDVRRTVEESGIAAVAASNFSLGVNLFISTVERAAKLFGQFDSFDCAVLEQHHNQKADAPSGTALTIGDAILANFPRKKRIRTGVPDGKIGKDELQVNSVRVGSEFGTHSVYFDSENDRVELTHVSRGRRGFALGAVIAAEWAVGKKGFFQFRDILSDL